MFLTSLGLLSIPEQLKEKIQRQGEHVGVVVLASNHIQRLQVAELQSCGRLINDVGSFAQDSGGILLSFGSNNL